MIASGEFSFSSMMNGQRQEDAHLRWRHNKKNIIIVKLLKSQIIIVTVPLLSMLATTVGLSAGRSLQD